MLEIIHIDALVYENLAQLSQETLASRRVRVLRNDTGSFSMSNSGPTPPMATLFKVKI